MLPEANPHANALQPSILLAAPCIELIKACSVRAYPREACGLLLGIRCGQGAIIRRLTQGHNLASEGSQPSFDLDPGHLVQAEDAARSMGWEVIGLWHSHPQHAALPSRADRDAALLGWSYPILALDAGGRTQLRSWRLGRFGFQEERILS